MRTFVRKPAPVLAPASTRTTARPRERSLDPATRAVMESRLGHDFSRVRVHADDEAARLASELSARAVTEGLDVFFDQGRYRPGTVEGDALIAHELGHVARAGAEGPSRPMLQPEPAADHESALKKILRGPRKRRPAALLQYLNANESAVPAAERLLLETTVGRASGGELLNQFLRQYPDRRAAVESRMGEATEAEQTAASGAMRQVWRTYTHAAYADAVKQWAASRAKAVKQRARRSRRDAEASAALQEQKERFEGIVTEAEQFLVSLLADYRPELAAAERALGALMDASRPVPWVQQNFLNRINDDIDTSKALARVERLTSYTALQVLHYIPKVAVVQRYGRARERLRAAESAEKESVAESQGLTTVPKGESRAERRVRLERLRGARRAQRSAVTERKEAERALTPAGAKDAEMQRFHEWRAEDLERRAAQVESSRERREAQFAAEREYDPRFEALLPASDVALADDERWWIYHRALENLESGFARFSMERTILPLVKARTRAASERRAAGVLWEVTIGTYTHHGHGRFDIMAPATYKLRRGGTEEATPVLGVAPPTVNLTRILGRRAGIEDDRIFDHVSSKVRAASHVTEAAADADVFAKIVDGLFGRKWSREQVSAYLEAEEGERPKLVPDPTRLLAALLFRKTLKDTAVSGPVETARGAVRNELEKKLRAALAARGILMPPDVTILRTVDASRGSFSGESAVEFEGFRGLTDPRTLKPLLTRPKAVALVLQLITRLVTDAGVTKALKALLKVLGPRSRSGRKGWPVQLVHKYHEQATGTDIWILVAYGHLRDVAPGLARGAEMTPEMVLGHVGASGNAVSPHVHMEIEVHEKDPDRSPRDPTIGYLEPLDFFAFFRRSQRHRAGAASQPAGEKD